MPTPAAVPRSSPVGAIKLAPALFDVRPNEDGTGFMPIRIYEACVGSSLHGALTASRSPRDFPPVLALLVIVLVSTGTMGMWAFGVYTSGGTMAGSIASIRGAQRGTEVNEWVYSRSSPL